LALRIGRSRPHISNTLRLLQLPPTVQRRVAAGVLSAGHARALLSLEGEAEMEKLAARIVAEGLSVRATEEIVSMGSKASKPAKNKKAKPRNVELEEIGNQLGDHLDTRVTVEMGGGKSNGKLIIEFASGADLQRIIKEIKG